jgi:hypothetical protein
MYRGVGMPPDLGPSSVLSQDQSFTPTSGTVCKVYTVYTVCTVYKRQPRLRRTHIT